VAAEGRPPNTGRLMQPAIGRTRFRQHALGGEGRPRRFARYCARCMVSAMMCSSCTGAATRHLMAVGFIAQDIRIAGAPERSGFGVEPDDPVGAFENLLIRSRRGRPLPRRRRG
jgi:hypothetical protein